MLSEKQKTNLTGLLQLMSDGDLKALANTVTNYLITPIDDKEAITSILQYTENLTSLINRKKITKELVFRYLHTYQVDGVSPTLDKRAMIELLLAYWGETNVHGEHGRIGHETVSSASPKSVVSLISSTVPPPQATSPASSQDDMREMAHSFAAWFYKLVNQGTSEEGQKFGPEHFWPDCRLVISLQNPHLQIQEERSSGSEAALLMAQLRTHFNLLFNPNISPEGTYGASEPHGAVVVVANGTVHRGDICAGVFEQKFLLLRDPNMQNNWRVKRSEMCLSAGSTSSSLAVPSRVMITSE